MPHTFRTAPSGDRALVYDSLERLAKRELTPRIFSIAPHEVRLSAPIVIFNLHGSKFEESRSLVAAVESGLWYLVYEGKRAVAAVEIHVTPDGTLVLANINHGKYVQSAATVLNRLNSLATIRNEAFEVRLLRSVAHRLVAIWLSSPVSTGYIYPLHPLPAGLRQSRLMKTDRFLNWAAREGR